MKTYTEEQVRMAVSVTAMIANQCGSPEAIAEFLDDKVPKDLHSLILAACLGARLAGSMPSFLLKPMIENMAKQMGVNSENPTIPHESKDISEMSSEELNAYIDEKLKEKREGK